MGCLRAIFGILLFAVAAVLGLLSLGAFSSGSVTAGCLLLLVACVLGVWGMRGFKAASAVSGDHVLVEDRSTAFLASISNQHTAEFDEDDAQEADAESWNDFADTHRFMLTVFRRRKEIIVDVLEVNFAEYDGRDVILNVHEPKGVKDRHLGTLLEWEREKRIKRKDILYFEPLGEDFDVKCLDDLNHYRKAVERGLVIAKRLDC